MPWYRPPLTFRPKNTNFTKLRFCSRLPARMWDLTRALLQAAGSPKNGIIFLVIKVSRAESCTERVQKIPQKQGQDLDSTGSAVSRSAPAPLRATQLIQSILLTTSSIVGTYQRRFFDNRAASLVSISSPRVQAKKEYLNHIGQPFRQAHIDTYCETQT